MKRLSAFAIALLTACLVACSTLGVAPPKTFLDRAAVAQLSVTALRGSALQLLEGGQIGTKDARSARSAADAGNQAIDVALVLFSASCAGRCAVALLRARGRSQAHLGDRDPDRRAELPQRPGRQAPGRQTRRSQAMSAIVAINAGSALITLLLQAATATQKYAELQARVAAEGRPVTLEDLKALRSEDAAVDLHLEAAIVAHEAADAANAAPVTPA
jgi:hypothetical protein